MTCSRLFPTRSAVALARLLLASFALALLLAATAHAQTTRVVAWGDNEYGQTNVPDGLSGVKAVAAGDRGHVVAVKDDGTVVAWGRNDFGQTNVPDGLSGVKAVTASGRHTVALKDDGTVVAWGGIGNAPDGLSGVTAIAAGDYHTVALKDDGTVVAWGGNGNGQTDAPDGLSDVTTIAVGSYHTVALKGDGTIVAWGWGANGRTDVPDGLTGVVAVAAGDHTVALKSDGTVAAWGHNEFGQSSVPDGLSGVTAIAAGGSHTVALKNDGTVVAWGYNGFGETDVPDGLSGVVAIAAGDNHTVALKDDGTVVAWGHNEFGQSSVPDGLSGVTAIAARTDYTVAIVEVANTPPIADAGPDQTVLVGQTVQLDGSGSSDPNGDPLTYAWTLNLLNGGGTIALSDPTAARPTFVAAQPGFYIATLTVNDGTDDSVLDVVLIEAVNARPMADAGPDQSVLAGQTVTLDGTSSTDPDGDELTFAWALTDPDGAPVALSDPAAEMPTFIAALRGTYTATLTVNDGTVDSAPDVALIEVVNQPPVADAGPDQSVIAGQRVTLNGASSTDPDGDPLTFVWTLTGASLTGADTASPMFCAADAGAYTAELVVSDGTDDSAPDEVTVTAVSIDGTIEALIADINALVAAGDLDRRFARSLTNRLSQARRHLDRGRSADAMFRTVRTRIGTLVRTGALTQAHADELTASLDAITGVLASPCVDVVAVQNDDALASASVETAAAHGDDVPASMEAEVTFGLAAPYPNPTSGRATVAFGIEDATDVRLAVYDALGREVAVLLEGSVPAGRHEMAFDGADLVAGTYLVRLTTADGLAAMHRLTLLR